jgi:hypothetical protein
MFTNQYEEHLASQPDNSRWDGFDHGDDDMSYDTHGETVIGRMTSEAGLRVVIVEESAGDSLFHKVLINGNCVFFEENNRFRAVVVARWWMDGCSA